MPCGCVVTGAADAKALSLVDQCALSVAGAEGARGERVGTYAGAFKTHVRTWIGLGTGEEMCNRMCLLYTCRELF